MSHNENEILTFGADYWNIRGSFRLLGLDIGTQVSLIRRSDGRFLFLDSYAMEGDVLEAVMKRTQQGRLVEAVINLHPFHTLHVSRMQALFPNAVHYGTARHIERFPDLSWAKTPTEKLADEGTFDDVLQFAVPCGVDFVSANDNVHFSSVLAYHPASRTIHVDDTLTCTALPRRLPLVGGKRILALHPTLALALEKRAGASTAFRKWLLDLCENWHKAENLCAAHSSVLRSEPDLPGRIRACLTLAEPVLLAHRLRHG